MGALIEAVATLLCRITSKALSENEPQYAAAIDSFVATSLVVAGGWWCWLRNSLHWHCGETITFSPSFLPAFDYSGGYYNPVLATSLKFGCRGHSHVEHFLVYWVGASAGAVASVYVYPMIKRFTKRKED